MPNTLEVTYVKSFICYHTFIINGKEVSLRGIKHKELVIEILNKLYVCLINQKSLSELLKEEKVEEMALQKLAYEIYPEETKNYLNNLSQNLLGSDKPIRSGALRTVIFGSSGGVTSGYYKPFRQKLMEALVNVDCKNKNLKLESNVVSLQNDRWALFTVFGSKLTPIHFDFSSIPKGYIKYEVKQYLKSILESAEHTRYQNISRTFSHLKTGINFILNQYTDLECLASITLVQAKWLYIHLQNGAKTQQFNKPFKPATVDGIISVLRVLFDWRIETESFLKTPRPKSNPFLKIKPRVKSMSKNTEYIPEEVVEQLLEHFDEIKNPIAQRMLLIMINTGLRYKDVQRLEEGCLDYDKQVESWMLNHIPYKVREHRRKKGLSDDQKIAIKGFVADEIETQIKETAELRQVWGLKEIFLVYDDLSVSPTLYRVQSFNRNVNYLIKNNNIMDLNGKLWRFTSKQCRKTVAVDMISNGATHHEVAQQLGHLSAKTTSIYYAEVRRMKLADLNHEFWLKKFKLHIPREQLEKYSEKERRELYVQFCLGDREVELGQCLKHPKDGPCSKRSGKTNCANCRQLCTGKQNLPKWLSLRDSAQLRVNDLIQEYKSENISDYHEYREYQQAVYELETYVQIIKRINEEA